MASHNSVEEEGNPSREFIISGNGSKLTPSVEGEAPALDIWLALKLQLLSTPNVVCEKESGKEEFVTGGVSCGILMLS